MQAAAEMQEEMWPAKEGGFLAEWEELSWSNIENSLPKHGWRGEGFTFRSFLDVYKVSVSSPSGASLRGSK
jgi:hypothetical protein